MADTRAILSIERVDELGREKADAGRVAANQVAREEHVQGNSHRLARALSFITAAISLFASVAALTPVEKVQTGCSPVAFFELMSARPL